MENPKFLKENFQTYACFRRNCQLFVTLALWSFCKCKDILYKFHVYKISTKEYKVVYYWAADEISVY